MNFKIFPNKDWNYLYSKYDWVRDMRNVPQDPIYHAEGNVETHTQMVLSEVEKCWDAIEKPLILRKEVLWAAALFHDVEKRSTTVHEATGRITSANHAKRGEFTARNIMYRDMDVSFLTRENIAKLVRYHGYPLWFMEKPDIEKTFRRISLEVNIPLLITLAKCDVLGRECADKDNLLAGVDLFEQYYRDYYCDEDSFDSDTHKFEYFHKPERDYHYHPIEKPECFVTMMSGLPGSGKDTFIEDFCIAAREDRPIISLDAIRRQHKIDPTDKSGNGKVIQIAKEQAKVYLRKKQSFFFNATNTTRSMREIWIDLFVSYGAYVTIQYVEVPYTELIKRNANREHAVPQIVIEKLIDKLEIPQLWEAHSVDYKVENINKYATKNF
jgi:predicted kinase